MVFQDDWLLPGLTAAENVDSLFALLGAAFAVLNTMTMAVKERRGEIALPVANSEGEVWRARAASLTGRRVTGITWNLRPGRRQND